ncbi:molecular chaperone DnaJ [Patescibacteria group bacterium]
MDYYKTLGIEKNASKDEIKKAFRKLAHKYHPDKDGGNEDKFKEVSEAYSVLSDEKKRSEYDTYGKTFGGNGGGAGQGFGGFGSAQGFQDFDLGDIFGDMFGGGRRVKRGNDISIDIEISFEDSIFGTERKVMITKNSTCSDCQGSGAKSGSKLEKCSACNGNGKVHETKRSMLGTFSTVRECGECLGNGEVPKEKCSECRGQGIYKKQEEIMIKIPAGISEGEMIRLTGAGEAISGGISGDLYIKVRVGKHKNFVREGNNLVMNLPIKLTDAVLGSEYNIPTLDGDIKLKIPAGIRFGEVLRVKGKGVPVTDRTRGDLLIKLDIALPNKLSRKAKKLFGEIKEEGI